MSYPPLPSNGETSWGNKFRAWADVIQGRVSDTGWRDVSSLVDPENFEPFTGGNSSYIEMRRQGDLVTVRMSGTPLVTKTVVTNVTNILAIPSGYRVDKYLSMGAAVSNGKMLSVGSYTTVFSLDLRGIITAGDTVRFTATWHTTNPWPTTLPGTPT